MSEEIKNKALQQIKEAQNLKDLEAIFRQYLGKKGELTLVFKSLKELSAEECKKAGQAANEARKAILESIEKAKESLSGKIADVAKDWIDVTAPGKKIHQGYLHPITTLRRQIEDIFQSMGFAIAQGPEVETEYYNFDALNIPKNHPARDKWDTLWLKQKNAQKERLLLRTHTSPVQIHYMEKNNPPLRVISPGRCFRYEATDATHDIQFHQIEGLMVDKDISVANFKGVLQEFFKRFLGEGTEVRLRHSYFPFTEPSFEVDIKRKGGKWLELMGAGMVHPNVYKSAGLNPKHWQGFAFGMGLERLAMILYKIDDIRLFSSGDLRFIKQF
jgi:phenylalanyl-tRNA synthetase alpha chain